MKGKIIIIVAPSGTGKSTLIESVMQKFPQLQWSVSYTTREIRQGEQDGKDYFFTSKENFEKMINENKFVEWAKVHSNYYGTSKEFVNHALESGLIVLFDLDVQGVDSFKKIYGDLANVIFIEPPSVEELEKRLRKRGTESDAVISERIHNAKNELKRKNDFDYLILNDDIEHATNQLQSVVEEILRKTDAK